MSTLPKARWPSWGWLLVLGWLTVLGCCSIPAASQEAARPPGQALSPDEALRRMTVPAGFEVRLFASEPDVRQPVAMEFDARGRLWVIQYLQYPNPAGLQRVGWDRYSRTNYDRVPEPPPFGPRGADRITICEDTDGDGRADRFHDFVDGLNLATGLAFGDGGVYVLQVPYLLHYADADGDDRPDGDPRVVLAGFGMEDAHSVANSLIFGPDGWLYGAQGSTVTARIRGIEFQQGVWRYHPPTDRFELFYEGGGNTWGVDFDTRGQLLTCTNVGGYALLHGVQGGYYWKSFGKHGELHNPHAYGYFEHVAHAGLTGAHVTCGGVIYGGTSFPQEFRGAAIAANLLSHRVDWHTLSRDGATFTARQAGTLLAANDPWFAPCDVTIGPEGAIYVADWHDQRTAHPDPDAEWDRTNGRIYVVAAAGTSAVAAGNLNKLSSADLVPLLTAPDVWPRRHARRILAARREPDVMKALLAAVRAASSADEAMPPLAVLMSAQALDEATIGSLLTSPMADVRRWMVRLAGDSVAVPSPRLIDDLLACEERETDVDVLAQMAATARRLPDESAIELIARLAARRGLSADAHVPLLLWWALEPRLVTRMDQIEGQLLRSELWSSPLFDEHLAPRMARRWAAEGTPVAFGALAQLLISAVDDESTRRVVEGATTGLTKVYASPPEELRPWLEEHRAAGADDRAILTLAVLLGHTPSIEQARALAFAPSATTTIERQATMVALVGRRRDPADVEPLLALVSPETAEQLQTAVLAAMSAFDDPRIAEALLACWPALAGPVRGKVLELLLARTASARQLLAAVDAGAIAPAEIPVAMLQAVAGRGDAEIGQLIARHWGRVGPVSPGEKLAEVRRLNNDLRASAGDAAAGRTLFREHCAKCHRLFGEGESVGPDLTAANRADRDDLLLQIVDPSAVVRNEYLSWLVETADGRSLTGMIVARSPQELTLVDSQGQQVRLPAGQVESLEPAPRSLMPERLLEKLKPQEVRDLFGYLQSETPP